MRERRANRIGPGRHARTLLGAGLLLLALPALGQSVPVSHLYGSGTDRGDELGRATALHGDTLLVGAPNDHYLNPPDVWLSGRVYAFRRTATGTWEEFDLWFPTTAYYSQLGGGRFGEALSLAAGDRLALVGASATSFREHPLGAQGAAYVFRYDEDAAAWHREARLRDLAARDHAECGMLVAVAGSLAVMNGDSNGRGLTIFRHVPGTDDGGDGPGGYGFGPWVADTTLVSGDVSGFISDSGRRKLAVADHPTEGERAVGGASHEDTAHGGDAGAVYVWRNDGPEGGPAAWVREARIEPSDAGPGLFFGASVALSPDGRLLVVGATGYDTDRGGVYVFRREGEGAASVWVEEAVLVSGIGGEIVFGYGVALSADPATGETLVAGAGWEHGVVFRRESDGSGSYSWQREASFTEEFFGYSMSLSGWTAAVGDWTDGTLDTGAGEAMVFEMGQTVAGEDEPESAALGLASYPNPSRGRVALALSVPEAGVVSVEVYDVLGRRVASVHEGALGAGMHRLSVSGLGAGVYLARAQTASGVVTARFSVVR